MQQLMSIAGHNRFAGPWDLVTGNRSVVHAEERLDKVTSPQGKLLSIRGYCCLPGGIGVVRLPGESGATARRKGRGGELWRGKPARAKTPPGLAF
jgi:hypothetical protein